MEKGTTKIGFNNVTISELNLPNLQLVAQVLGQSSALEIIEWEVEEFLAESDRLTRTLRRGAQIRKKRDQLMEFIGQGLNARHRIINQISLLSQPDTTWETEELYVLYNNLFKNFDMEDRVERIEKMLELSSDVSKLLLEILNARRAEFLEIVIILLIVAELLVPLWGSLKTLL